MKRFGSAENRFPGAQASPVRAEKERDVEESPPFDNPFLEAFRAKGALSKIVKKEE